MSDPARLSRPAVNSHNEWDPLEEIIIGTLDGLNLLALDISGLAVTPRDKFPFSDANLREMLFTTDKPSGEGDGGPTGSVP